MAQISAEEAGALFHNLRESAESAVKKSFLDERPAKDAKARIALLASGGGFGWLKLRTTFQNARLPRAISPT